MGGLIVGAAVLLNGVAIAQTRDGDKPVIVDGVPYWIPLVSIALSTIAAPVIIQWAKSDSDRNTGSLSYAWRTAEANQTALIASKDQQISLLAEEIRRLRLDLIKSQNDLDKEQLACSDKRAALVQSEQEKRSLIRRLRQYEDITGEVNDK